MKRVPPNVRMKDEVEALLRGEGQPDVPAAVPMDGFVRGTARYMLQGDSGTIVSRIRRFAA
jgi:hypothetical protein